MERAVRCRLRRGAGMQPPRPRVRAPPGWQARRSAAYCAGLRHAPADQPRWTLRLLSVEAVLHETVRQALKKRVQAVVSEQCCLALPADPELVRLMEDVLAEHERPPDPTRPVVCLDETSRQLLADAGAAKVHLLKPSPRSRGGGSPRDLGLGPTLTISRRSRYASVCSAGAAILRRPDLASRA